MTEIEAYIFRSEEPTEEKLKDYFDVKYKGLYFFQMRVEATKLLRSKKMSYKKIAGIIYGNTDRHDLVHRNLKKVADISDHLLVKDRFNEWISEGLYPVTKYESKHDTKNKEYWLEKYCEVVNKSELINYICKNIK